MLDVHERRFGGHLDVAGGSRKDFHLLGRLAPLLWAQHERVPCRSSAFPEIIDAFRPSIWCLTDNANRTASNIRVLFRKGQLGASGSVAWDFDYLGMIEAVPETGDADPETAAIEAGAQDLEPGESGATLFLTAPTDMDAVSRALPAHGFAVQSAHLGYRPKNPVTLGAAEREEVEAFLEAIDADDDVQRVFVGLAG